MRLRALTCLLLWPVLVACTPANPLDQPIAAGTALAFDQWSYRTLPRLTDQTRTELREARRHLLLDLQLRQAGLSPDEQHATVLALLHQRTPREVIVMGHRLHLARLRAAQSDDRILLDLNQARILDSRLSAEVAASLADRLGPLITRQKDREAQIAALLARLAELGASDEPPPSPPPPESSSPRALPVPPSSPPARKHGRK
jgi:hypothetical protein